MIRRLTRTLVLFGLMFALGMGGSVLHAQLVDEEAVGRLTIGGGIGVLVPSMSDVNNNINTINPFLNRDEIRNLDRIHAALLTHADIRYRLGQTPKEDVDEETRFLDRISLGFKWGAINSKTGFDVTRSAARFFSRATVYSPYVLYHFPWLEPVEPRVQIYAGGGPLFLRSGSVEWILEDRTNNSFLVAGDISELAGRAEASGSATGFNVLAGASYMLSPRFSVAFDFGYRGATISNLELDSAEGQEKRFPGDDDDDTDDEDIVRRPGNWSVIDFFFRDRSAEFDGISRTDPNEDGGCQDCPLYYQGGDLEVDYSGPFATFAFRAHF